MILVGIDYSMSCPAIVTFDASEHKKFCLANCNIYYAKDQSKRKKPKSLLLSWSKGSIINESLIRGYSCDEERYMDLSRWAVSSFPKSAVVLLEGYSYGSKGMVFHIGENTGILKARLWKRSTKFSTVPPSEIKRYFTGIAQASKKEVYDQFLKDDPEGAEFLNSVLDIKVSKRIEKKRLKKGKLVVRDKGTVSSPASDIIDAYYLCKYLRLNIKKYS